MKSTQCEREPAVLAALATGSWPDELRNHLSGCLSCADAVLVVNVLRAAADAPALDPLPDPATIWRAARRNERLVIAERATRPIRVMTRLGFAAFAATAVSGLIWFWPTIASHVGAMVGLFFHPPASPNGHFVAAILALASLVTFSAAFALFDSWVRE